MKADLLRVVESAHELGGDDKQWLQGLTDAVGPLIDAGHGVYGTTIDASDPNRMRTGEVVSYLGDPTFIRAITATNASIGSDLVMLAIATSMRS